MWYRGIQFLGFLVLLISCNPPTKTSQQEHNSMQHTPNLLANEASPYLLQHAQNPVNWMPWGDAAFEKARKENKLVLVSIGYSACHWCHVMEHESFEDTAVANIMNEHFVCIKVDREERPDVDEIYMTAVQIMTQQGGWPLNCFTLPNGKPVYGGTYFRKEQWMEVLHQLSSMYAQEPEKVREYGEELSTAVKNSTLIQLKENETDLSKTWLDEQVKHIAKSFDKSNGGHNGAPKFPMPVEWEFLLEYCQSIGDKKLTEHLGFTLEKIAQGGIYDHIGGGFARYSTDPSWKVPHFEKMLYDNGQLISLYAKAYRKFKNPLFKRTVEQSIEWLQREMQSEEGGFYAALDADSEGEEGKFYVWTREEIEQELSEEELEIAQEYFNLSKLGYWEHGNYIALLKENGEDYYSANKSAIEALRTKLLSLRSKRVRPGLDDKQICSWNALTAIGLFEAFVTFENPSYLKMAEKCLAFIGSNCWDDKNQKLYHYYKKGGRKDADFLEDYATYIQALLTAYEVTQKEAYLELAKNLSLLVEDKFSTTGPYYTDRNTEQDKLLITPTISRTDNVTPSANALMAKAWYKLGIAYYKNDWMEKGTKMAQTLGADISRYPAGYVNWLSLLNWDLNGMQEIALTGPNSLSNSLKLQSQDIYNAFYLASAKSSDLPFLKDKFLEGDWIFICQNRACKKPVKTVQEALQQLKP